MEGEEAGEERCFEGCWDLGSVRGDWRSSGLAGGDGLDGRWELHRVSGDDEFLDSAASEEEGDPALCFEGLRALVDDDDVEFLAEELFTPCAVEGG